MFVQIIFRRKFVVQFMDQADQVHYKFRCFVAPIQSVPKGVTITFKSSNHSLDAQVFEYNFANIIFYITVNSAASP